MYYEVCLKELKEKVEMLEKKLATVELREELSPYELTADQAKKLTEKTLAKNTEFSKKHIMSLIKESTEIGFTSVKMPYLLSIEIRMWLINLGYSIDSDLRTIYWK